MSDTKTDPFDFDHAVVRRMSDKVRDTLVAFWFTAVFALLFAVFATKCVLLGAGVLASSHRIAESVLWGAISMLPACSALASIRQWATWRRDDREWTSLLSALDERIGEGDLDGARCARRECEAWLHRRRQR